VIPPPRRDRRGATCGTHGQTGAVAGVEALAFGALVFVLGTLLVANLWAAVDGRSAADGAARAAARAVLLADPGSDAAAVADRAALAALAAHGVPADRTVDVRVRGTLARCEVVEVTVAHQVPLVVLPSVGVGRRVVTVRSTHAAVVDPFASGLPATSGVPCA
jgi:hypothetical protein